MSGALEELPSKCDLSLPFYSYMKYYIFNSSAQVLDDHEVPLAMMKFYKE